MSLAAKAENKPDARSFHAGKVPGTLGATVPIGAVDKKAAWRKPKKESALTKHRKWLTDLQKTKDDLECKYINDMVAKQENADKVCIHIHIHVKHSC
jgi:hypothetical protein